MCVCVCELAAFFAIKLASCKLQFYDGNNEIRLKYIYKFWYDGIECNVMQSRLEIKPLKLRWFAFVDMIELMILFLVCHVARVAWHTYWWGRTKKVKERMWPTFHVIVTSIFLAFFIRCHFFHGCYYIKHFMKNVCIKENRDALLPYIIYIHKRTLCLTIHLRFTGCHLTHVQH